MAKHDTRASYPKSMPLGLVLGGLLSISVMADAHSEDEITWDPIRYDPATVVNPDATPADLIIPLPCGGAMAFMRIDTEARADSPLDDQRFRMGAPDIARAPFQYTRQAYIRGSFDDVDENSTYYYLARYELSRDQDRALEAWATQGACPDTDTQEGVLPQTNLTWQQAQGVAERLTTFVQQEHADQLPKKDDVLGYFRLPTEEEWEFAARGGTQTNDPAEFNAKSFPMEGRPEAYYWYSGRRSAGNDIKPIGVLKPNPLGLHDMYGNAEEMVLGLFSLNRGGRDHGQFGGFITRGGSYRNKVREITSATRAEYPFYFVDAAEPFQSERVGLRLALSAPILTSDRIIFAVEDAWDMALTPEDVDDPNAILSRMIEEETVLETQTQLENVQSALVAALQQSQEATERALRRAVFAGATSLRSIDQLTDRADRTEIARTKITENMDAAQKRLEDAQASGASAAVSVNEKLLETLQEQFTSAETRLAGYADELEIDQTNFVTSVVAVFEASTPDSLNKATELLKIEMQNTDQIRMVDPINRFFKTVQLYRQQPDMSKEDILATLLDSQ